MKVKTNSVFNFFWKNLRLSNPWNAKIPVLMALLYLAILLGTITFYSSILIFAASLILIIGFAGLAYFLNDLGDQSKDLVLNKPNATQHLKSNQKIVLVVGFFILIILPWLYLPFDSISFALIILLITCYYSYAMPPFRLKEKGWLGVICDSLYGHLIPALLAAYTYYLATEKSQQYFKTFILILACWQFFLGLRNILLHQIKDFDNDRQSATHTLAITIGKDKTSRFLVNFLFVELVFFLVSLFALFYIKHALYLVVYVIYVLFNFIQQKNQLKQMDYRAKAYLFLDDFYIQWLPLLVLVEISWFQPLYLLVAFIHVLLFKNKLKVFVYNLIKK